MHPPGMGESAYCLAHHNGDLEVKKVTASETKRGARSMGQGLYTTVDVGGGVPFDPPLYAFGFLTTDTDQGRTLGGGQG